jgi:DNA-directed RNA polymerase specialized sigma24 family protein
MTAQPGAPRAARLAPATDRPRAVLSDEAAARMEALFRDFAADLERNVARVVRRRRDEVEDACQFAWAVLARRPDVLDSPTARGWLATVAIHECRAEAGRAPLPVDTLDYLPGPSFENVLEARAALRLVAQLRPVRKRVFERRLAGLSYTEIAAEQGLTYTNVSRQVTESRAELRRAA